MATTSDVQTAISLGIEAVNRIPRLCALHTAGRLLYYAALSAATDATYRSAVTDAGLPATAIPDPPPTTEAPRS